MTKALELADELERQLDKNAYFPKGWYLLHLQGSDWRAIITALRTPAPKSGWLPIASAPKSEAVPFLVLRPIKGSAPVTIQVSNFEGRMYPDARDACIDWEDGITDATNWQSLPLPPDEQGGGA